MPPEEFDSTELLHVHVRYEIDMLSGTYQRLKKPIEDHVVGNSLIESFCLHARSLLDFFNNEQGLHASEFTSEKFSALNPEALGIPNSVCRKLNTQIAHLTKKRVADAKEKIGPEHREQLFQGLTKAIHSFEEHLLPPHRERWLANRAVLFGAKGASATNEILMVSTGVEHPPSTMSTSPTFAVNSVTLSRHLVQPPTDAKADPKKTDSD